MKAFFIFFGIILTGFGVWNLVQQSPSNFLSSWGFVSLALGLTSLLSLSGAGFFLSLLGFVTIFVAGVVRIFLGTGDWWLWLLTAAGMFVIWAILSTRFADDEGVTNSGDEEDSRPDIPREDLSPLPSGADSENDVPAPPPSVEAPSRRPVTRLSVPGARQVMAGLSKAQPKASTVRSQTPCGSCGAKTTPGAKFCGSCGSATG